LSDKLREENLTVVRDFELEEVKTKAFAQVLNNFEVKSALVVIPEADDKMELSSRNIKNVKVLRAEGLNVYDILKYDHVVLLENAVSPIEEALS
jgi:large subunit ribosomal protein L4